jgi:hypothetical protein
MPLMFDTDVCGTCGGTFELEQMRAFLPPCWYCAKCVSEMDICNFCHQGYPKDSADTPPNQRWWADSEHTLCKYCLKLELLALCTVCKQPKLIINLFYGTCQECIDPKKGPLI